MDQDPAFVAATAEALASLPTVEAVALGGSRTLGTSRPDSDWDFALYYRGDFRPDDLRGLGWPGEVSAVGAWGGGVFNGGAWLTIDGRRVDVHYRDLAGVERELIEAQSGRFHIEPLLFHLAGIPSYLVVAELALNRVLHGTLPRVDFPPALRRAAPQRWLERAELNLSYAAGHHAPFGRLAQCAGLVVVGASELAHAVLAARGEWVTNEKTLLERAGLRDVDRIVGAMTTSPEALVAAVADVLALGRDRLAAARA